MISLKNWPPPCESHPDGVAAGEEGGPAGGAEDGRGDVVGQHGPGPGQLVDVRGGEAGVTETSNISDTEIVHQQDQDVGRPGVAG